MPPLPSWLLTSWRWIVVIALAFHLVAITLMAFPSPGGGLHRPDWDHPTVKAEFEAWNGRIAPLGWTGTVDELQDRVYVFAKGYSDGHATLKKPFKPYYSYAGTSQSWRMFVAPLRNPSRLQVRVRQDRVWRVVYEGRHPEHTWLAYVFDHDRMRSAIFRYGWPGKYKREWFAFSKWVAGRAAVDFPGADRVELRFANYKTLSPVQARSGETAKIKWVKRRAYDLRALR